MSSTHPYPRISGNSSCSVQAPESLAGSAFNTQFQKPESVEALTAVLTHQPFQTPERYLKDLSWQKFFLLNAEMTGPRTLEFEEETG